MQNITATVSDADLQAVKDALAAIRQKLPFLTSLTPDARRAIFKTGPNSLSFVEHALTAAQDNPSILPASFPTDDFASGTALFAMMTEINTLIAQLVSDIDDTRLAIGGQTMAEATQVYNYVKAAVKTTPGLKPVADQLGERFQHASPQKPAPAPVPAA